MNKSLIIFGASGHAKVVIDIALENNFEIAGIIDNEKSSDTQFYGCKILGDDEFLKENLQKFSIYEFFIAIGDNKTRFKICNKFLDLNYANLISKNANISPSATFGQGNIVMPGCIINADTQIANHTIVNSNSSIDHDCTISNFASIAPGCTLAGNVKVKDKCMIGIGTKICNNISIGTMSIVGGGSFVNKDIEPYVMAYGSPCKKIRDLK